jgi:PEGA domain.
MTRIRPSLVFALAFAIPLAAHPAPAQTPLLPTNNKISVSTEPTLNAGLSDLQVNCEIYGGALYIDRDYAGSIPYTGKLSPGSHYFELDLPGYDAFGLWLTLDEKTEYTIVFNPDEKVPIFATNDRVSVSTEPTLDAGLSDLEIYCEIGGGRLFIDGHDFGPVPSSNVPYTNSISPGSHYIELDLIGYYKLGFWLMLDEKTKYTMTFHPERITSYLSIEVEPADASIRIDGRSVGQGIVKIVEGRHRVEIKRFGYFERTIDAEVSEQATSFIALSLEKAPFAISDLGFDRPVFNPRNVGTRGKTSLSFIASSYGSARAEIFAPDGSLVATLEFPNIETWAQSRVWEGLGPDRAPLPDGVYSVMLTATPAPDAGIQSDARVSASAETRIDSSVVIRSYGTASAVPGLLYMPDPLSQPAGVLAVEASWFAPWGEPQASAIDRKSVV